MSFRSPRPIAALALAVAFIVATPALAVAHASTGATHSDRVGLDNLSLSDTVSLSNTASSAGAASSTGSVHTVQPAGAVTFPSAASTVIASIGFIDGEQVGNFFSAARGDSVEQIMSGPARINKAILRLDVTNNSLTPGNRVDWRLSINGTDLGTFTISSGQLGGVTVRFKFGGFPRGGVYDVKLRVLNEVPPGGGSMALRYAGSAEHSITLKAKR